MAVNNVGSTDSSRNLGAPPASRPGCFSHLSDDDLELVLENPANKYMPLRSVVSTNPSPPAGNCTCSSRTVSLAEIVVTGRRTVVIRPLKGHHREWRPLFVRTQTPKRDFPMPPSTVRKDVLETPPPVDPTSLQSAVSHSASIPNPGAPQPSGPAVLIVPPPSYVPLREPDTSGDADFAQQLQIQEDAAEREACLRTMRDGDLARSLQSAVSHSAPIPTNPGAPQPSVSGRPVPFFRAPIDFNLSFPKKRAALDYIDYVITHYNSVISTLEVDVTVKDIEAVEYAIAFSQDNPDSLQKLRKIRSELEEVPERRKRILDDCSGNRYR